MAEKRINSNFPDYYIYEDGDIVNIKSGRVHNFEIHKRCADIQLKNKDGVTVHCQLARLIFQTFFDKYQIHHCDIQNTNNEFENLILVSQKAHNYLHKLERENKKMKEELKKYQGIEE